MKITILTTGTRGDTQPYVALGKALQETGYRVLLAAQENFADFVRGHGLSFFPVRGDVTALTQTTAAADAMQADNPLKFFRSFQKPEFQNLLVNVVADFYAAAQGADALVYHPGAAAGYFFARRLGIPGILASPFPMTPTREYPSLIFYDRRRWGRPYNILTHKLFERGFWLAVSRPLRTFWRREIGPLPDDFGVPFSRPQPTLISGSEYVFPRPADWPAHVRQTGYWFLDAGADWQPPANLQAFLDAGEPPVYVGFGSVGDPRRREALTEMVVEALRRCGRRGVLATGWQGMGAEVGRSTEIFTLKQAPHDWLFPRMAAVVHHGGAGTTAAGLRAGVPAVVLPFGNDQFAWGRRVFELGVGAHPQPRKKLSAEGLADAITYSLQEEIQRNAARLGRSIAAENGAHQAARLIKKVLEEGALSALRHPA